MWSTFLLEQQDGDAGFIDPPMTLKFCCTNSGDGPERRLVDHKKLRIRHQAAAD
jgi:hypothetical protein